MIIENNTVSLFSKKVKNFIRKDFLIVSSDEDASVAIKKASETNKYTILVCENKKIKGIITEKDIFKKYKLLNHRSPTVSDIMNSPVIFAREEDLLFHAVGKMRKYSFKHIPVINENKEVTGILYLHDALSAELGSTINQIDALIYEDSQSVEGLIKIKNFQVDLVENLLNQNLLPREITYLISFLNNFIYYKSIEIGIHQLNTKYPNFKIPKFCVLNMGSGGRMESYLHPDQDNGIIYAGDEDSKADEYFFELAKIFTKILDDCGIPLCKGNLMASNPLWRHSLQGWKDLITEWTENPKGQSIRNIEMLYDFKSVYGDGSLAENLRDFIFEKISNKKLLRYLYKSEENTNAGLNFFGGFKLEKDDPENKGLLNLKHAGTLPLVESIRLYSIKHRITSTSTFTRLKELHKLGVFDESEYDFFHRSHSFLSLILLKNQVKRARKNLTIKNFIDVHQLNDLDKRLLKMSFKKIEELKQRVRGDFSAEYF